MQQTTPHKAKHQIILPHHTALVRPIVIDLLRKAKHLKKMVISFNTRFQDIKNRINLKQRHLLGKRSMDMQSHDTICLMKGTEDAAHPTDGKRSLINEGRDHISQASRHKRQKMELAYAAHTIKEALEEAGRPTMSQKAVRRERALPSGSVDLNLVTVITSSDHNYNESVKANQTTDSSDTTQSKEDEIGTYYKAFYSNYSALIQSTRNYYTMAAGSKSLNDENEKKSESSSSMEGLSSWTPTSSNHDINDNKKIDDDNRSDSSSLEGEGSISYCLSDEFRRSPKNAMSTSINHQDDQGVAFSVVG